MGKKNIKLEKFNKVMLKMLLVMCILIVALIGVCFYKDYQYKKVTKRENLNLDEFMAITIAEELGDTNDKKERIIGSDMTDGYKRIFLNMDSYMDNDFQIQKCINNTMKVLEVYTKDKEFYEADFKGISIQWVFGVVDKYGNTSDEVGCIITFDKPELYKIKWGNITRDGFINVAKTFWVHDLLLK